MNRVQSRAAKLRARVVHMSDLGRQWAAVVKLVRPGPGGVRPALTHPQRLVALNREVAAYLLDANGRSPLAVAALVAGLTVGTGMAAEDAEAWRGLGVDVVRGRFTFHHIDRVVETLARVKLEQRHADCR